MIYMIKFWFAFLLSLALDALTWMWWLPVYLWVAILRYAFRKPTIAFINWLTEGMGLSQRKD